MPGNEVLPSGCIGLAFAEVRHLVDQQDEAVPSTVRVMIRAHTTLSPGAKAFYRSLMRVAREIEAGSTGGVSLARVSPARILSMDRR